MDIRKLRISKGMSQAEFAEYFNIPKTTLQGWEQGRRIPPEYVLQMMKKILDFEDKLNSENTKK